MGRPRAPATRALLCAAALALLAAAVAASAAESPAPSSPAPGAKAAVAGQSGAQPSPAPNNATAEDGAEGALEEEGKAPDDGAATDPTEGVGPAAETAAPEEEGEEQGQEGPRGANATAKASAKEAPRASPSPSTGASPAPAAGGAVAPPKATLAEAAASPSPAAGDAAASPSPAPTDAGASPKPAAVEAGASPPPSAGDAATSPSPAPTDAGASPKPAAAEAGASPSTAAGDAAASPSPAPTDAGASPKPAAAEAGASPSPAAGDAGASPSSKPAAVDAGTPPAPAPSVSGDAGASPAPSASDAGATPAAAAADGEGDDGAATASAGTGNAKKVLILTGPGFALFDHIQAALDDRGVPYDVVRWNGKASPRPDLTSILYTRDGTPKQYAGIVLVPNLEATGAMKRTEVKDLWRYQRITGARTVKFNVWPTTVGFGADETACSSAPTDMTLAKDAPFAGADAGKPLNGTGLYRCPGNASAALDVCGIFAANFGQTGITLPCKATPILTVSIRPEDRTFLPPCNDTEPAVGSAPGQGATAASATVDNGRARSKGGGGATSDSSKRSSSPTSSGTASGAVVAPASSSDDFFPANKIGKGFVLWHAVGKLHGHHRRLLAFLQNVADNKTAAAGAGSKGVDKGVAGVLVKYGDGRESMAFFFDCAKWSPTCNTLANLSVSWMTEPRAPPPPIPEDVLRAEAAADRAKPDEPEPDLSEESKPKCIPTVGKPATKAVASAAAAPTATAEEPAASVAAGPEASLASRSKDMAASADDMSGDAPDTTDTPGTPDTADPILGIFRPLNYFWYQKLKALADLAQAAVVGPL